jgi:hypothetical protein
MIEIYHFGLKIVRKILYKIRKYMSELLYDYNAIILAGLNWLTIRLLSQGCKCVCPGKQYFIVRLN